MLPSWISDPYRSYLGGSIYHTADARYNSAVSWYRSLMNLGYRKTESIVRLARFIRYGVLNCQEASLVFQDRLPHRLNQRYLLMIHWIDDGWQLESDFYFKFIDWSWLNLAKVENTTLFP